MVQTVAERKKQAYLHQLRQKNQLHAAVIENGEPRMVPIENPHLVEGNNGHWRVEGEFKGHMLSRFVKPPPKD